jgi:hypothetical protein
MAIFHDAYVFSLDAFTSHIKPRVEKLQSPQEYHQLRSDALQLFESNTNVRHLLSEYGGWDKNSIQHEIAHSLSNKLDTAFWLVMLLYGELKPSPHILGLGSKMELLQGLLRQLKWTDEEITLLVQGNSFEIFAQEHLYNGSAVPEFWKSIRPNSTSAQAGWIAWNDIENLARKLQKNQQEVLKLTAGLTEQEAIEIRSALQSALDMLSAAKNYNSDLCLIISG